MNTSHRIGKLALSFGILLGLICSTAPARGEDAPQIAAIDQAMQQQIAQHEIAGAVTLVATHNSILHLSAIGEADIANHKPMKTDSLFWIASMTKPITATAIMMLEEQGKLSVDDPVGKYIPELAHLKTKDGVEHVVTLKHLLTHSSGMAEATSAEAHASKNLEQLIAHYTERPLLFAPGSKWQYCQAGINTLGRIIEIVSGESYPDFLQQHLFTPLGMKDTTFYPTQEQADRLAVSYKRAGDQLEPAPIAMFGGAPLTSHDRYPAPNGGLFSTAPDYARFCQMIINEGTLDGHQYLKRETVEKMTSVQSGDLKTGFTPGNGWGLGWCIVREPQGITAMLSPGTHGHGGAYGTQAWIDSKADRIYILMVQRADFPNSDASPTRMAFQQAATH